MRTAGRPALAGPTARRHVERAPVRALVPLPAADARHRRGRGRGACRDGALARLPGRDHANGLRLCHITRARARGASPPGERQHHKGVKVSRSAHARRADAAVRGTGARRSCAGRAPHISIWSGVATGRCALQAPATQRRLPRSACPAIAVRRQRTDVRSTVAVRPGARDAREVLHAAVGHVAELRRHVGIGREAPRPRQPVWVSAEGVVATQAGIGEVLLRERMRVRRVARPSLAREAARRGREVPSIVHAALRRCALRVRDGRPARGHAAQLARHISLCAAHQTPRAWCLRAAGGMGRVRVTTRTGE